MAQYVLGITAAAALLIFVVELLRRGIIAEKFAALWLLVSITLLVFAAFPVVLRWLAEVTGFTLPANLLFALAGLLLLAVSMQLSHEVGRLDFQSRRLAEEVALLRHDLDVLREEAAPPGRHAPDPSAPADGDDGAP